MKKTYIFTAGYSYARYARKALFLCMIFAFAFLLIPSKTQANTFNPLDPFGLFSSNKNEETIIINNITNKVDKSQVNSNNTTNSNNTNNVIVNNGTGYSFSSINSNTPTSYANTVVSTGPGYAYVDAWSAPNTSPSNDDYYDRDLYVSCYPSDTSIDEGDRVTWTASASGGGGSYSYRWSGTDSLSGSGRSVTIRYNDKGNKYASVKVTSGSRSKTVDCNDGVYVRDRNNDYDYDYNYDYNNYNYSNSNYYYVDNTSSVLSLTCYPNITTTNIGNYVTWTAYPTGGNGNYTYSWSGTDSLKNVNSSSISKLYNSAGSKTATVTVRSNGRSVSRSCGYANVYDNRTSYVNYSNTTAVNNGNLFAACYPSKNYSTTGSPVTWSGAASGGNGNYSYSWTGSDNLSGYSTGARIVYYSTGLKTASITVTSGGEIYTANCGGTVSVSQAKAYVAPVKKTPVDTTPAITPTKTDTDTKVDDNSDLNTASLFALDHIPWGWVMVLIMLVLVTIIAYLVAQKNKKIK
ncbi:MAG: hypothetical protein Q7R78_00955 [bacterium]|nr:hypothetical protein [bacterium]